MRATSGGSGRGIFGKVFMTLFFSIFFAAGAAFTYYVILGFIHTLDTYSWIETPAQIENVSIGRNQKHSQDSTPYELSLTYSYEAGSQTHRKDLLPDENRYSMYEYAAELADSYPAGTTQECFVNPDDPSESVLYRESLLVGFVVFFPLIFVAVGLGGIYYIWFSSSSSSGASRKSLARSKTASDSTSGRVFLIVGIVFSLFGFGGCYFFAHKLVKTFNAQSWVETPATVIESSVITHESDNDDGGTSYTYSVDMFYQYEYEGQAYKASRYDLFGGSSGGYDAKKKVVDEHPAGTKISVFVNPSNPKEAAVQAGYSWFLLFILFPLVFLLVGLGVLYSQLGASAKKSFSGMGSDFDGKMRVAESRFQGREGLSGGPEVLKPQASPLGKVIGSILICAFWNGIVSVFVYQAYSAWESGNPEWFLMIFLIPFVLVGLVLVVAVFYSFLAFFNPIVELTVSTRSPRLGSEIDVTWQTKGNASKMTSLAFVLQGEEEVRYTRGTDTVTDRHTFFEEEVTKIASGSMIKMGSTKVELPADSMHSFEASNNKIIWKLHLKGDIPRWPDVSESYNLNVLPKALEI